MSNSFRKKIRRAIAYTLYYSGILWLIAAVKLRNRAVVLMYHRVLPASADTYSEDAIVVRPETFARQMAFLKRHLRPLSTEELAEHLHNRKPLPSMSCVVTFDDGWIDNAEHALPILREQGVPATIYVATDYIGTDRCFWQERVARRMMEAIRAGGLALSIVERETRAGIAALSHHDQRRAVRNAVTRMKRWSMDEIDTYETLLIQALQKTGGTAALSGYDRFMSWPEVADLSKGSKVTVGAHGCSHTPLTALARDVAERELQLARKQIESAGAGAADSVAYPNGNFSDEVVTLARQAGYRVGFTTDKGTVGSEDDPLRLRRVNIHQAATDTMPEFLCSLLLIFHRLRRPSAS